MKNMIDLLGDLATWRRKTLARPVAARIRPGFYGPRRHGRIEESHDFRRNRFQ